MKGTKTLKSTEAKSKLICDTPICALSKWYEAMFEKLGWMVLAQKRGMVEKVMNYKSSVDRLEMCLKDRIPHIKDADKKMDLEIMVRNIRILKEHIAKDF